MAHPYKHAAHHRAATKRAHHILASGGCVGSDRAPHSSAARKAHGGSVGGSDKAPFTSAGVQDRGSRGKTPASGGKTTGWQAGSEREPFLRGGKAEHEDRHSEGTRGKHRFARGGKVAKQHVISIHVHHPIPMGGPGMAAPGPAPMAPPPTPMGGPPPGPMGPLPASLAQGLVPHPGMSVGGVPHGMAGATSGVGRLDAADWHRRHHGG